LAGWFGRALLVAVVAVVAPALAPAQAGSSPQSASVSLWNV